MAGARFVERVEVGAVEDGNAPGAQTVDAVAVISIRGLCTGRIIGMDEVALGARLRTLRRWRGLTQSELAGLAGVSPSFVSMVEHGQRLLDRRSHISALASRARPLDALARTMTDLERFRRSADYTALGTPLAGLLDELYVHAAAPADEKVHRLALDTLVEACVAATLTAPQRVRNSAAVRQTVAYLLDRATAAVGGRELRGMAARMDIPH